MFSRPLVLFAKISAYCEVKWLFMYVSHFSVWQTDPSRAGVTYEKEFIVCSLDLLSGLAEGLGSSIESLVCTIHLLIYPARLGKQQLD